MVKIKNDKYYTSRYLAEKCIDKTFKILGKDNIKEIIEPSAGNGNFSLQLPNCKAYDIEPEHDSIVKQNFLTLDLRYKKGRLFIGNPPYGESLYIAQQFFKKCVKEGDYIAFILPISQLWNQHSMYEFDLIHSEDLGKQEYSDRKLHCCFNIYKRPVSGELNKKKSKKLKDITIIRQDSKKYNEIKDYDLRMCYWGNSSAGKILKESEKYSAEYKIVVNNPKIRGEVIDVLTNVDWRKELNCISSLKIQQFHINKILERYIPDIK